MEISNADLGELNQLLTSLRQLTFQQANFVCVSLSILLGSLDICTHTQFVRWLKLYKLRDTNEVQTWAHISACPLSCLAFSVYLSL